MVCEIIITMDLLVMSPSLVCASIELFLCRFPNSYTIHSFCLGHRDFVTSLSLLSDSLLVSGSGDGTVRIWRSVTGFSIILLFLLLPGSFIFMLLLLLLLPVKISLYLLNAPSQVPGGS